VQAFVAEARDDIDRLCAEHEREISALMREVAELREIVGDVVTALRQKADSDVGQLRRQLELALVRLCQRDPNKPLN
jgi:hypothetical protein